MWVTQGSTWRGQVWRCPICIQPVLEAWDRGYSPTDFELSQGIFSFRFTNRRQSTHHLAFDEPVELHWWTCGDNVIGYDRDSNPGSFEAF
jgi:hypothetical protein